MVMKQGTKDIRHGLRENIYHWLGVVCMSKLRRSGEITMTKLFGGESKALALFPARHMSNYPNVWNAESGRIVSQMYWIHNT